MARSGGAARTRRATESSGESGKSSQSRNSSPLLATAQGRTTTRGRRTRAALVTAAREVFEEVGFRDARISDIAARSGTSYGVFYHYFGSKNEILHELFTAVTGEMYTASQARTGDQADVVDKIRCANRQYLEVAARNAKLVAMIEELAYRDPEFRELKLRIRQPFVQRNEAGIRSLQKRGLADRSLDPSMAASLLGGMIEHFTLLWFVHGIEYDEDAAVETLTRLWAQAIGLRLTPDGDLDPATGVG